MALEEDREEERRRRGPPETPLKWTQMEDGEEKRAAFFRETGLDRKEEFRPQNASIPSRRGRIPWKLISVLLLAVFVVWSFTH